MRQNGGFNCRCIMGPAVFWESGVAAWHSRQFVALLSPQAGGARSSKFHEPSGRPRHFSSQRLIGSQLFLGLWVKKELYGLVGGIKKKAKGTLETEHLLHKRLWFGSFQMGFHLDERCMIPKALMYLFVIRPQNSMVLSLTILPKAQTTAMV